MSGWRLMAVLPQRQLQSQPGIGLQVELELFAPLVYVRCAGPLLLPRGKVEMLAKHDQNRVELLHT